MCIYTHNGIIHAQLRANFFALFHSLDRKKKYQHRSETNDTITTALLIHQHSIHMTVTDTGYTLLLVCCWRSFSLWRQASDWHNFQQYFFFVIPFSRSLRKLILLVAVCNIYFIWNCRCCCFTFKKPNFYIFLVPSRAK